MILINLEMFIILMSIHIIGAIITIHIHNKTGMLEDAVKHGDGIRFAKPSDIIYLDCIVWELLFLLFVMDKIDIFINKSVEKFCK